MHSYLWIVRSNVSIAVGEEGRRGGYEMRVGEEGRREGRRGGSERRV
jgi:hypothetical protein